MLHPDDHPPLRSSELELLERVEADSPAESASHDRALAMRRDRAMLRAVSGVRAPAGLLDAALDRALGELDPDLLTRLGEGEPVSAGLPVSGVQPERFSVARWAMRHREAIGLVAAASVVLVAGWGAVLGVRALLGPNPAPQVAESSPGSPGSLADSAREPAPGSIADEAPTGPSPDRLAMEAPGENAGGSSLTLFEAAALLREGRVMILARGGSSARVSEALSRLASVAPGMERSFTLTTGMPEQAFAALGLEEIRPAAWAGEASSPSASAALPVRTLWTVTVQPSAPSLAALLDGLRGAGLRVELRSTGGAIPLEPVVAPAEALWWSRPASSWRIFVAIPVVVETLP